MEGQLETERSHGHFVDRGESFKKLGNNFRTIPREHIFDTKNRHAFNDEFIGSDKYHPRFSLVHTNITQ